EAGFPITSPDDFSAVRQIATEVRRPVIAALARATAQDIDRAAEALEVAERGRIHTFIATSDVHLARKLRISREECLDRAAEAVRRARSHADDVEFSAEDATRTDPEFLAQVVRVAVEAGATTINIPDTVGYTYPTEYRALIEMLFREVPGLDDVIVSVHCHNDLGLAVANSLAAIEAGARQVECTINGIGERAGNAALEEIAMALHVRHDVLPHETGIHTREIYRTSQLLSRITGIHPQPNKAIVGKNAFAHESGIHQDGMIKDRSTYEIMTPELVGVPESKLVLGKHSGRHALAKRCRELGYELDGPALDRAYKLFKLLADQKKTILDEDLLAIVDQGTIGEIPQAYRLRALDVLCGARRAEAKVRLANGAGIEKEASATGDGPLAAAFSAVDVVTGLTCEVEDLSIRAATPGRDAVGEVNIRAVIDGRTFTGRGASTDVVDAAVRAYVHATNKALYAREVAGRLAAAGSGSDA
ncbi:MAG TPA: 2-isopropylmalate synthase, partial [Longimicrobiales bacterium]|nr:2-isopropylmalate synthase [Longimicrobiales bacterium]